METLIYDADTEMITSAAASAAAAAQQQQQRAMLQQSQVGAHIPDGSSGMRRQEIVV